MIIRIKNRLRPFYHSFRKRAFVAGIQSKRFIHRNKNGINLIGFYSSIFGVAEVGRFFAHRLHQLNIPFSITNIESDGHRQLNSDEYQLYREHENENAYYHKNIFFANADTIPWLPYRHFVGRKNAAVFFWEFDDYFDFTQAAERLDEVIVFTDFIATAVRKSAPAGFPVTKITFPFFKNWTILSTREEVRAKRGIDKDAFVLFFNFDFHSTFDRKNPTAILQALNLAFADDDNILLVLKTLHFEEKQDTYSRFYEALSSTNIKNKVLLVNDAMSRDEVMTLLNATDAYISLHRSEGLGLGMLEAMSMGKPVIGTGFGGNLDFMNADNSLLVDFTLTSLERDVPPYKKGWLWAEPNIETAAHHLRKLYTDVDFRNEIGRKAQASVDQQFDKDVFRKEIDAWLTK